MLRPSTAIVVVLTISLIGFEAFGQTLSQTIRGTVVDAHSGEPLTGATVVIVGTDPVVGAVTDPDGRFRISDVAVGRHILAASYVGYNPASLPNILVGSGKEVILEIQLSESLLEYDEVVVRAAHRKGLPQNEMVSVSAMSVNVEELSRLAATFDDPGRSILSFPGVRGSGDDVLNEIIVRGNSPRGILWRIEGVDVPNPNHFAQIGTAGGGISMLSNSMLRTSNFYSGAFPSSYGNALSGVFDIHLRNGNNERHEYAFEAGAIGIQAAAEGPFSSRSAGAYLVNYRYSFLGLLQDIGLEIPGIIRFQDLSFKLQLPTARSGHFTFWGLGGVSSQTVDAEPENFDPYNEKFDQRYGVGSLHHTIHIGPTTYLNSSLSASYRRHEFVLDSLGLHREETEDFINRTFRLASSINRKFNAQHTAGLGAVVNLMRYDYHADFFQNATQRLITLVDDSGDSSLLQAFFQWQYRMTEALTLNTGLHYSRLALNGSDALEPRAGFRWALIPGHVVTGGFGLHSRAETPATYLAQAFDEHGEPFQPNLNLGLLKACHYVVGYENHLLPDVRVKTEFYYQDLFEIPVLDPEFGDEDWMEAYSGINALDGYTTLPLVSSGSGRNYGIEATIEKYFTGSYYLMATGSLFESKYDVRSRSESDTRFNGNFIGNILGGKEIRVGRNRNNILSFNARLIWQGNNRQSPIDIEASRETGYTVFDWSRPYAIRLDSYFRLDLGVKLIKNTARHSHIISLNIQNVTNRRNEMSRYYSFRRGEIVSELQFGILPNISYRIEF